MSVVGVVLGAGRSSRFGEPKQLLPYGDTTLLGQCVRNANASSLDRVVVVLGRASGEVRDALDFGRAEVVENTAYGTGCASSLLAGLDAAGEDCEAIALLLGDQPGVEPEFIDRALSEWNRERPWAQVCSYRGGPGHPFVFSREAFGELRGLHGDKAVWKLVERYPERVRRVEIQADLPPDVDTPEDYQRVLDLRRDAPEKTGVSAVLLAAGSGSRFGGGKLLADFGGKHLIEATLENLEGAPIDETVAVLGADAEVLRRICDSHEVGTVENPDWHLGQSTSVLAGLRAVRPEARAAVILLADQPFVGAGAVGRLVAAFEGGAEVAVATYGGKRRNPVLFSRSVWSMLEEELSGDEGARGLLRRRPELVVEVPCDGVADPADVDTKEDLRRLEEVRGSLGTYKIEW